MKRISTEETMEKTATAMEDSNKTIDMEEDAQSSESNIWHPGQGQFNSNSEKREVTDTVITSNENDLLVTEQVYESFDSCLNDAVNEVAEALSIAQLARGQPKPKKAHTEDLQPIVFARFNARHGKQKSIVIKCLPDTGASGSFISSKHSKNLKNYTKLKGPKSYGVLLVGHYSPQVPVLVCLLFQSFIATMPSSGTCI